MSIDRMLKQDPPVAGEDSIYERGKSLRIGRNERWSGGDESSRWPSFGQGREIRQLRHVIVHHVSEQAFHYSSIHVGSCWQSTFRPSLRFLFLSLLSELAVEYLVLESWLSTKVSKTRTVEVSSLIFSIIVLSKGLAVIVLGHYVVKCQDSMS